jgi:type II secretory pathway predicted ATPase ExeA
LVDLRLLVSSAVESAPPLKILLSGQESLRQTHRYIDYQLAHSGGDTKIFDENVKDLIHEFTGGNPRSICVGSAMTFRSQLY